MEEEKIISYISDEITQEEKIHLFRSSNDNLDLRKELIEYQNLKVLVGMAKVDENEKEIARNYNNFLKKIGRTKRITLFNSIMKYAAIALVCILSTLSFYNSFYSKDKSKITIQELYVPSGQRAEIVLPDGSKVWVNADSKITYPSVFGKERKIYLDGEAFFKVAKDAEKPFIVSSQSIDIKALGTEFNVMSYDKAGKTFVHLVEGSIKIYSPKDENKGLILKPGECIKYENNRLIMIPAEKDNLLWINGIYVFKSQPLDEIIKRLELYYDVSILIENLKIKNQLYTGKFRQRDGVMEILRVIQRIHKFKIEQKDDLNIIVLK